MKYLVNKTFEFVRRNGWMAFYHDKEFVNEINFLNEDIEPV